MEWLLTAVVNKSSQIWYLQTQIYYLTVLELRSLNWTSVGNSEGVGRAAFLSRSTRREFIFLLWPVYGGCPHSVACGPFPFLAPAMAGCIILSLNDASASFFHLQGPMRLHCAHGQSRIISPYVKVSCFTT